MIRDNAKKIVEYMLEKVLLLGDLNEDFIIRYDELTNKHNLESENHCRVCCQYLDQLGYANFIENDNGNRSVRLTAKGIDFLESM